MTAASRSHTSTAYRALRFFGRQHWIPYGRERLLRLFCHPERVGHVQFETNFFGSRYTGFLDNFIDWNVFFYGAYAIHELLLLRDIAREMRRTCTSIHFCDVGANVGQHTLFMSRCVDAVSAFEPFPDVRFRLDHQLADNHISNVSVFPVALSDSEGEMDYYTPSGSNLGTGSFARRPGNFSGIVLKLPVRSGDRFIAEHGLRPLNILKLDVEGDEASVLRGLRHTIERDRPVILMELSDDSRHEFGSLRGFADSLYQNHRVFEVARRRYSASYRLRRFDFCATPEVLVIPQESDITVGISLES